MTRSQHLFTFLFLILIVANSCKEDDADVNPLLGTWVLSTEVSSNCTDPNDDGSYTCTEFCLEYFFTETTITIGLDTYDYTYSENIIQIVINETLVPVTYTLSGGTLTLNNLAANGCRVVTTLQKK